MKSTLGAIVSLGLALTVVISFWVCLSDMLVHKDDPGVIPAIWISGVVVHGGLLGILYYHLKGWGVINFRKR